MSLFVSLLLRNPDFYTEAASRFNQMLAPCWFYSHSFPSQVTVNICTGLWLCSIAWFFLANIPTEWVKNCMFSNSLFAKNKFTTIEILQKTTSDKCSSITTQFNQP